MVSVRTTRASGFSMIEVLVTLIIILVALLGIAALQARAQVAELEAQQRAQALILMSDIVDRINANREAVSCFAVTTNTTSGTPYIGAAGSNHLGSTACTASTSAYNTQADSTITALDNLLKGNTETAGGENVGAMIGARACVNYDSSTELGGAAGTGLFTVIVTWQGMSALIAPAAKCAVDLYGDETKRRAVSTTFRVADLL